MCQRNTGEYMSETLESPLKLTMTSPRHGDTEFVQNKKKRTMGDSITAYASRFLVNDACRTK